MARTLTINFLSIPLILIGDRLGEREWHGR